MFCNDPPLQAAKQSVQSQSGWGCRSKLEQSIVFHVPPFNASDVFFPSYATSSSSDSDHDGGPDRCASLAGVSARLYTCRGLSCRAPA